MFPQLLTALKENILFDKVKESDLNFHISLENLMDRKSGESIYAEGEPGDCIFLLISGEVALNKTHLLGKPRKEIVAENNFFGEEDFLENMPRTSSAYALEDSTLVRLDREILSRLCTSSEQFFCNIRRIKNEFPSEELSLDEFAPMENFEPMEGLEPLENFEPGEILRAGEVPEPGETTDPGKMTEAGKTTDPGKMIAPEEMINTEEMIEPEEMINTGEMVDPGEMTGPGGVIEQGEMKEPGESDKTLEESSPFLVSPESFESADGSKDSESASTEETSKPEPADESDRNQMEFLAEASDDLQRVEFQATKIPEEDEIQIEQLSTVEKQEEGVYNKEIAAEIPTAEIPINEALTDKTSIDKISADEIPMNKDQAEELTADELSVDEIPVNGSSSNKSSDNEFLSAAGAYGSFGNRTFESSSRAGGDPVSEDSEQINTPVQTKEMPKGTSDETSEKASVKEDDKTSEETKPELLTLKTINSFVQDIKKSVLVSKRYAEHLRAKELTPDVGQVVDLMLEQLCHAAGLVQSISSYSEEKVILNSVNCSLNETLDAVIEKMSSTGNIRNYEIIKKYDKDITVKLDRTEFFQACMHIVSYACDSMPEGGKIYITTKNRKKSADIMFKDTGPGILESLIDKIFEPFSNYGKNDSNSLGLSVTRKIIAAHGGSISVKNTPGEGATFIITLASAG